MATIRKHERTTKIITQNHVVQMLAFSEATSLTKSFRSKGITSYEIMF